MWEGNYSLFLSLRFHFLTNLNPFLVAIQLGMNSHIGEPVDTKPNDNASEEEYLAVDDEDIEIKNSSNKPQFANFSVVSLLARKCPDKVKEKQYLAENCTQKDIHFPSSGEELAVDEEEVADAEQVGIGKLSPSIQYISL